MFHLRHYQNELKSGIYGEWRAGARNALGVLPTGGGKTAVFGSVLHDYAGHMRVACAHRNELILQMSLTLCKYGLTHRVAASDSAVREIARIQRQETGRVWIDPMSDVVCASVDTLMAREKEAWMHRVRLGVMDEAHHVLKENKWGASSRLFPNSQWLGVTATPTRADGKGLGSHSDGIFDTMVVGPCGRDLMNMGYLSDYEVYCPDVDDLDFDDVETGSTGDLKMPQLRKATHASRKLVGNVVEQYLKLARGKLGITFAVDVEQAAELANAYNAAGVPAQFVSGKTDQTTRSAVMREFRQRRLLQLVNVDLFGEGLDVPGVEVVSMARRTDSFSLFSQQTGRCWRPVYAQGMPLDTDRQRLEAIRAGSKPKATLIDHVGNYIIHSLRVGLPEDPKNWTLDSREKRGSKRPDEGVIALTACDGCTRPYPKFRVTCPWCGHAPRTVSRSSTIQEVEGDLHLVSEQLIAELRNAVARIDGPVRIPQGLTPVASRAVANNHLSRQQAQSALRQAIASWGGWRKHEGLLDREAQRLFYHRFGVDVLTAQTLGAKEALELKDRVERSMLHGV